MRVHILDLNPELQVQIDGTESWLERIYSDFPVQSGEVPRLVGDLHLTMEEGGTVLVTGKITYAPIVSCGRCDLGIPWPMSFKLHTRFLPPGVNESQREKNLSRAELDAYFLENDEVDLECLINDTVQTGLPSRLIATTDDGSHCRICDADLTEPQVYGTREEAQPASPFAALKNLKLPN